MGRIIYKIECGVLLDKKHKDFDAYSNVYDKKNAYFDEIVYIEEELDKAKERAKDYVDCGVNGTYAVISEFELNNCEDYTLEEIQDNYIDILSPGAYDFKSVIYSLCKTRNSKYIYPKTNGKIIENFVGRDILEEMKKSEV